MKTWQWFGLGGCVLAFALLVFAMWIEHKRLHSNPRDFSAIPYKGPRINQAKCHCANCIPYYVQFWGVDYAVTRGSRNIRKRHKGFPSFYSEQEAQLWAKYMLKNPREWNHIYEYGEVVR